MTASSQSDKSDDGLIALVKDIALSALPKPRRDSDCPLCGGDLVVGRHCFDGSGGAPDCSWLYCLDCNYQTEPE